MTSREEINWSSPELARVQALAGDELDYLAGQAANLVPAPVQGRGAIWFLNGLWAASDYGGTQPCVLKGELDHWVKKCEGAVLRSGTRIWSPSTRWHDAGTLVEKDQIMFTHNGLPGERKWLACTNFLRYADDAGYGHCPSIAITRCFLRRNWRDDFQPYSKEFR